MENCSAVTLIGNDILVICAAMSQLLGLLPKRNKRAECSYPLEG